MRFMMLMIPKGYEKAAPDVVPDVERVAAMMKYNEALSKAGVLVAADGLHPPSVGARVSFADGRPTVTPGPFRGVAETLGGYWMIRAKTKEEAIEWATRCPASRNEMIEVRQVQEMADFPPEVREAAGPFGEVQAGAPKVEVEPYVFFEGRCEEALDFYRRAIGAEVTSLMRYKESPEPPPPGTLPPGSEEKVMHATFRVGETTILASDGRCLGRPTFEGFSLSLLARDDAEADRFFESLASGGQIVMPLQKTFFASRFGMVTDRFGVGWMVLHMP